MNESTFVFSPLTLYIMAGKFNNWRNRADLVDAKIFRELSKFHLALLFKMPSGLLF